MRLGIQLTMKSCSARITGFSLAASSCSLGYSRTKSPWPMVLFTCTMLWHIRQLRPACASGLLINLPDRLSNMPLKSKRRIVAARAPFGGLHAGDILHVLDAFAIPLIVEGRKMMSGAVPLFVNVRVAALAGFRLHEIFRGNFLPSLVCAELGKNFPCGPSPSPSMDSVGMRGLLTRISDFSRQLRASTRSLRQFPTVTAAQYSEAQRCSGKVLCPANLVE